MCKTGNNTPPYSYKQPSEHSWYLYKHRHSRVLSWRTALPQARALAWLWDQALIWRCLTSAPKWAPQFQPQGQTNHPFPGSVKQDANFTRLVSRFQATGVSSSHTVRTVRLVQHRRNHSSRQTAVAGTHRPKLQRATGDGSLACGWVAAHCGDTATADVKYVPSGCSATEFVRCHCLLVIQGNIIF